jgi:hypothetical protein
VAGEVRLALTAPQVPTQQKFASCAWWRDISKSQETYKIGFAQGVVVGALSDLLGSPVTPDEKVLAQFWDEGQIALLQKPALMAEVFDKKCADYRNTRLSLQHVAFLGTLEVGGLPQSHVEAALDLFRAPGGTPYSMVFAVLAGR